MLVTTPDLRYVLFQRLNLFQTKPIRSFQLMTLFLELDEYYPSFHITKKSGNFIDYNVIKTLL